MSIFGKRQKEISRCSVLYCFEFDRDLTKELFNLIVVYFKTYLNIDFKYCGYYDETYSDTYGKFESIKLKIFNEQANEIVNFTLDDDDIRKGNRKVSVEFNINRPIMITISLSEGLGSINLKDFTTKVYSLFATVYGFAYSVENSDWCASYALGDEQHSKNIYGITRLSKETFFNWQQKCKLVQNGLIRDVYKENILNTIHLEKPINGGSFKQFITDNKIGTLQEVNSKIHFWKLNDQEIEKARVLLYKTAIII